MTLEQQRIDATSMVAKELREEVRVRVAEVHGELALAEHILCVREFMEIRRYPDRNIDRDLLDTRLRNCRHVDFER